jgi:hypothetical protein
VNGIPVIFAVIAGVLVAALPRRAALIPLLVAAAYTPRLPIIEIGPASLSVLRVLVAIGVVRAIIRGERLANGVNIVDRLVFVWAFLLIAISVFHTSDAWTFRIGLVWGELGFYVLCRIFLRDAQDVRRVFGFLVVALAPLAALMLLEKYTGHNYFSVLGLAEVGFADVVNVRDGHIRAYGPFFHPILAGTVGATCVPMALYLWRSHRARALIGLAAGFGIVFASTSTGPVLMALSTCLAMFIWRVRERLIMIRWAAVMAIIGLQLVMNDPVYFLMARIDVAGGSQGWHRAQLIRSSIIHLDEWWAVGTEYTRHWMPTGIPANQTHTDITNHILAMGVVGGLPLLIVFVSVLLAAFRTVGRGLGASAHEPLGSRFLIWTLGAMLFGQVVNFFSISLFDHSVMFFYLILAAIGAVQMGPDGAGHASRNAPEVRKPWWQPDGTPSAPRARRREAPSGI